MTTSEIQKELLHYYQDIIGEIKTRNNIETIQDILWSTATNYGICNCANRIFGIDIYTSEWVKNACTYNAHWVELPVMATEKSEVIKLLKIRIDKLKSIMSLS